MSYKNLASFFKAINDSIDYVVLRNFEELQSDLVNEEHPDIDILCEDRDKFLKTVDTASRGKAGDKRHRKVVISGKEVFIDVREVGDGYYDTKWEQEILASKIMYNELIYVPDEMNYYYSLLYHSLIQKKTLSVDYEVRLGELAAKVNQDFSKNEALKILEVYMREYNYKYAYPESPTTTFNISNVDKSLIENSLVKKVKRSLWYFVHR